MGYDVGSMKTMRRVEPSRELTPQQRKDAIRVVCGAQSTRGAKDAKLLLEALGLNPRNLDG
jgi:hypothetical protein